MVYYAAHMSDTAHHDIDQGPGLLSNAIAIIAFIVVIAIVIWGLLHLANISTSWFSSLFPRSNPTIQIAAPASAESGTPVSVSWDYSGNANEGSFAFLYQCRSGVSLHDADGARVLCGTVHPLVNAASSTLTFTPELSGAVSSTTLPFSIIFMPASTSSKQVQGTATIALRGVADAPTTPQPSVTITPAVSEPIAAASTASPKTEARAYVAPAAAAVPATPADLRVSIIEVVPGDMSTVRFDIANVGGSYSGSYTFTAHLPTQEGYVYSSPVQSSLGAGDHVVNTLQFTQSLGGTITIVLHPTKADYAGNNSASRDIDAAYASAPYDAYAHEYGYNYGMYDVGYDTYGAAYPYSYPTYTTQYEYPQYDYGYGIYPAYDQYYTNYGGYDSYTQYPMVVDESGYYPVY